jgi:hypothetical protein
MEQPRLLAHLPREVQLLVLCAARDTGTERIAELIDGGLDWQRVLALAAYANAAPVLFRRVTHAQGALSESTHSRLRALAMTSEFRQAHLEARLESALDALQRAGVRPVLLKGAALAATEYRSFSERPMGDIDLLVARDEATLARAALLQAGWTEDPEAAPPDRYRDHHHLAPLEDGCGSGLGLELHTDLFFRGHPFRPLGEVIRGTANECNWRGRPILVPGAPQHLVYICLHFAWSHQLHRGAWRALRDVNVLLVSPSFDWEDALDLAERTRGGTSCYWTLRLVSGLTGTSVPASVLDRLRPPGSSLILGRIEKHFLHQLFPTCSRCPSVTLGQLAWRCGVRPRWSGHGRVRPWDHNAEFADPVERPPTVGGRFAAHLRRRPQWHAYLRAVGGRAVPAR